MRRKPGPGPGSDIGFPLVAVHLQNSPRSKFTTLKIDLHSLKLKAPFLFIAWAQVVRKSTALLVIPQLLFVPELITVSPCNQRLRHPWNSTHEENS